MKKHDKGARRTGVFENKKPMAANLRFWAVLMQMRDNQKDAALYPGIHNRQPPTAVAVRL